MRSTREPFDLLVVGGGALGLFTLDRCVAAGASAVLVESSDLGTGQTAASQGIIHAGTKYSLAGLLGRDAQEAAGAALLWRTMLGGGDAAHCDLRGVKVLSDRCYLWRSRSIAGAVGLAAARVALQTAPRLVDQSARPNWLANAGGDVLELPEQVIDPLSLIGHLAERHRGRIARAKVIAIEQSDDCVRVALEGCGISSVTARRLVLAAGAGNESLAMLAGVPVEMQRRPLCQALLRGSVPEAFGHCIDGARTRLTITSACSDDGVTVWSVGGQLAEDGVGMTDDEFHSFAAAEIRQCVSGLDLGGCELACWRVDRAEPRTKGGGRPASGAAIAHGRVTVAWPVKLVLAPKVAGEIAGSITCSGEVNRMWDPCPEAPSCALPPWASAKWRAIR